VPLGHQSPKFLLKIHKVLTSSLGARTIQEVLVTDSAHLNRHVRCLALCVRSLCLNDDCEHEQDLPVVFNLSERDHFLVSLMVQLLDTLFSLFLPFAWGRDNGSYKHRVISDLIPLRDALSCHVNSVECACRCIVQWLPCQEWRRGADDRRAFISSVDPIVWKEQLEFGTPPKAPESKLEVIIFWMKFLN
jgi:hypothetical protein